MKNIHFFRCFLILLIITNIKITLADLPISTEIKYLVGKWKILKTRTSLEISTCGSSKPNSNLENLKIKDYKDYLINNNYEFISELNIILSDDFVLYEDLYNTHGNEHRRNWKILAVYDIYNRIIGSWTTIYDEGFEIRIGDETYTALMHYESTGLCDLIKNNDVLDSNGENICYVTNHNRIRFGWLNETDKNGNILYGCFYAEKNDDNLNINTLEIYENHNINNHEEIDFSYMKDNSEDNNVNSHNFVFNNSENLKTKDERYHENDEIQRVSSYYKKKDDDYNENTELNWHRVKYGQNKKMNDKLSNDIHQKYACPCSPDDQETYQRNNKKSIKVVSNILLELKHKFNDYNSVFLEDNLSNNELDLENYEDIQKSHRGEFEINELPLSFTWGDPFNKNTREYKILNQLNCGSCYTASTLYALKRRIEISLTKKLKNKYLNDFDDNLSIQSIISCSFYDQGCNGGYPFLVSKMSKLQGVTLNKFFPYAAKDTKCIYDVNTNSSGLNNIINKTGEIKLRKSLHSEYGEYKYNAKETYNKNFTTSDDDKWYAKDYNYIGGCYGCNQCNGEKIMMNEIYRNGPIISSFEVSPSLYKYYDGVYYDKSYSHAKRCSINTKNQSAFYITGWEKVNHVIVIVGWGEEIIDNVKYKYWIARNSWGNQWGKEGYFKIIRGINHNGIESMSVYIDPDFTRGAGALVLNRLKKEIS